MACLAAVLRLACSWSSCLASCPVLITAYPLHRVLVGVSFSCLGSGFVRFESRRGLALVRDCLSTSSALGLSWVGLRPVFSTASVFVVAPSPVRCGSRGSCCLAGPLLARYWLACGTERHCTEQPYRTVLGRRGLRAFYEVTPPWVCLDQQTKNKTKRLRTARPLLGWTPLALTPSPCPTSGLVCLLSETVIPPVGPIAR